MIKEGRIPCFVDGCKRTAPADRFDPGTEIICGKHFKLVPKELIAKYRRYAKKRKLLIRLYAKRGIENPRLETLDRLEYENWQAIRAYFETNDKPEGLENFLEEVGL